MSYSPTSPSLQLTAPHPPPPSCFTRTLRVLVLSFRSNRAYGTGPAQSPWPRAPQPPKPALGKRDVKPVINVQDQSLTVYDRKSCYKYLGKSLSLSGEDTTQVVGFIEEYQKLVKQIAECRLPLALKASAFNNMALAKTLHHFYNTRLTVQQIEEFDDILTKTVRDLYGLYSSTTRLVIYLPRDLGGIGIKRISDVYTTT